MKALQIIAIGAMLCVVGCAKHENTHYTAPSVVGVRTSIEKLKPHVNTAGFAAIKELNTAVDSYQAQVEQQSIALSKAQQDSAYWHQKHSECLSRLWWWRGLAIGIVAFVVIYIGVKTSWRFLL